MMMWPISSILVMALILLAVAFFTLVERKILGYSHERLGPNKVGYYGLIQPFSDAIKLFTKESSGKFKSQNYFIYFLSPVWGILMSVIMWSLILFWGSFSIYYLGAIVFFCMSSFSVYFMLLGGWSSLSKYSLIGSYRSSSQAISYEVVLVISFLVVCFLVLTYDFFLYSIGEDSMFVFLLLPLVVVWVLSCYAETNRSPFDFSEGESELVSGFNTEYGGGSFSLIFIGEYSSILFLSFLSGFLFFNFSLGGLFWIFMISFSFLWVRCSFPRLRYDKLMLMCWKGLLIYILSIIYLGCYFM